MENNHACVDQLGINGFLVCDYGLYLGASRSPFQATTPGPKMIAEPRTIDITGGRLPWRDARIGLVCALCTVRFVREHGKPVLCVACWELETLIYDANGEGESTERKAWMPETD